MSHPRGTGVGSTRKLLLKFNPIVQPHFSNLTASKSVHKEYFNVLSDIYDWRLSKTVKAVTLGTPA